jgi:aerobic-type carbon monoxide dehydrogenase small subunit (CoxS/CutS family)
VPQIKINGVEHTIDADPQMPLLWAIRDIVGLTRTKFGCNAEAPSDQQIIDAMSGNICRCGTYQRIRQAIKSAAEAV